MIWVLPSPTCTPIAPRASTEYPPSPPCPSGGVPEGGSVLTGNPRLPPALAAGFPGLLSRLAGRGTRCPVWCGHRPARPARPAHRRCTSPPVLPPRQPASSAPAPPGPDPGHGQPRHRPALPPTAPATPQGPVRAWRAPTRRPAYRPAFSPPEPSAPHTRPSPPTTPRPPSLTPHPTPTRSQSA